MNQRNFQIDNAKAILAFFIVLAHYTLLYSKESHFLGLNVGICSFHMATLIFLNGYLTRNIKSQRRRDILTLLIPYLIIQAGTHFYLKLFTPQEQLGFGVPIFANWYILALFIWRMTAPYFDGIKYPILTSILISLGIGLLNDFTDFLDLQRVFAFLPYFIMGRYLSDKPLKLVFNKKPKAVLFTVSLVLILCGFVVVSMQFPGLMGRLRRIYVPYSNYKDWLTLPTDFSIGARMIHLPYFIVSLIAIATRIFMIASSSVLALLFFQVVPQQKTWYTKYGRHLIYTVGFHMVFLFPFFYKVAYKPFVTEAIAIPLSILIVIIVNLKPVKSALKYVLNPLLLLKQKSVTMHTAKTD